MDELWTEVTKVALGVGISLFGVVSSVLIKKLHQYLNAKTDNEYALNFSNAAVEVVLAVESTIVSGARKAAEDGKISREELQTIFRQARIEAIKKLTERFKTAPDDILKSAPEAIEAALMKVKLSPQKAQVSQ